MLRSYQPKTAIAALIQRLCSSNAAMRMRVPS
jgi:hypothetical protein